MKFMKLTKNEYQKYVIDSINHYAEELVSSGNADEETAQKQAKQQFTNILPNGLDTENHHMYYAYDGDQKVGFIWYGFRNEGTAFIYDFFILEDMRKQGFGKKVMLACEQEAKEKGASTIRLHVFGHNLAARALYESLNYETTSIQMKKKL